MIHRVLIVTQPIPEGFLFGYANLSTVYIAPAICRKRMWL